MKLPTVAADASARLPRDALSIAAPVPTAKEARQRLAEDGPKLLPGGQPRTWPAIVGKTAREPMLLLPQAAGALYVVFVLAAFARAALRLPESPAFAPGLLGVLWFGRQAGAAHGRHRRRHGCGFAPVIGLP